MAPPIPSIPVGRRRASLWASVALLAAPPAAFGQTLGGALTPPVNTPAATTTTVIGGSTLTATGGTAGFTTAGTLVVDTAAGATPGPISVQTVGGNAFTVTAGGQLQIPNGANVAVSGVGTAVLVSGGTASLSGVAINNVGTASSGGAGILANPGATVILGAGNSINVTANNGVALGANGGGVISTTAPIAITAGRAGGFGNYGLYIRGAGSSISLPADSTITLPASQSVGVAADGADVPLGTIGSGLTINLNGAGGAASIGVLAVNGGDLSLQNLTVQGAGVGAGAWARGGSRVTLSGQNLITVSTTSNPAYSTFGQWLPTGAPLPSGSAGNTYPAGLLADGTGVLTSTGTTVNVTSRAAGVAATLGGTLDLTRNTVTTTGANSFGFRIDSGQITARDSTVATSGGGRAMFINFGPGLIDLTNTAVSATGPGTAGLFSLNGTPAAANIVRMSGGSLTSETDVAIAAQGPLTMTMAGGASASGPAAVQAFDNAGFPQPTFLNLALSGASTLTGDASAEPASRVDIALATSSVWTGAASPAAPISNVGVDDTSTWNVTGDSTLSQDLTNAGLTAFVPPSGGVFRALTVRNYVGQDGVVGLQTVLESDGAPSDRLVINGGTASGTSGLRITNAGGGGALTLADGILVVQALAGGTTAPGTFSLARPVVAGPYEYLLFRGGTSGADNWFLRSALVPVPPEPEPPAPTPPAPEPDPTVLIPLIRQEVSLITALPAMATLYGLTLIDTRHERVGEEEHLRSRLDIPGDRLADGAWGRVIAHHGERDYGLRGIYGDGPSFKYDFLALQAGMDVRRQEHDDGGWDQAGVYLAVGHGEADVEHGLIDRAFQAGDDKFDSVALGGYWTWFTENGLWWDAVVQGAWYDFVSRSGRFAKIEADGFGLALSFEIAKPFEVRDDDPNLVIEPQAQLVYQTLDLDDIHEPAADIRFRDTDSLAGRIGLRVAQTWTRDADDEAPRLRTGWGRFDLWKQFRGDPVTEYSSAGGFVPFHANLEDEWWRLGGGITAQTNRATSVFASATYNRAFNGDSHGWDLKAGARVEW